MVPQVHDDVSGLSVDSASGCFYFPEEEYSSPFMDKFKIFRLSSIRELYKQLGFYSTKHILESGILSVIHGRKTPCLQMCL